MIKVTQQNDIFQMADRCKSKWMEQQPPTWNFSKYLIDENGALVKYFDPAVSPLSDEVIKAIDIIIPLNIFIMNYNDIIGTIGVGLILIGLFF